MGYLRIAQQRKENEAIQPQGFTNSNNQRLGNMFDVLNFLLV